MQYFFRLTKTFDIVNRKILLRKLEHYGIHNTSNLWFRLYLENRKQLVSLSGADSETQIIKHGAPQCLVLGGPRWGFAGCGIRPFLVSGFRIGSKIVAGYGIQISAGCRIGHKIIAGFGNQISRGNELRSENLKKGYRNSRIDSKI